MILKSMNVEPIVRILDVLIFYFTFCECLLASLINPNTVDSTIRLGGMFPIGGNCSTDNVSRKINSVRGIQRAEAMFYALDKIKNESNILQNIDIKVTLINTCDDPKIALDGIVTSFVTNYDGKSCRHKSGSYKNVVGFIGPSTSDVSKDVARLLRLFAVPQISYASTSPELDDRELYKYFLRTVPPDQYQVKAIRDICVKLEWTSVAVIYSEGDYGQVAHEHFQELPSRPCIAKSFELESEANNLNNYKQIFTDLENNFKTTKVIILFCTYKHFKDVLTEANHHNFMFIIGEIYGIQNAFEEKRIFGNIANRSMILSMKSDGKTQHEFQKYFNTLKPDKNLRNKWFRAYWQEKHNCSISEKSCLEKNETVSVEDDKIPYVIDAVYALTNAIDKIYKKTCPNQNGICEEMYNLTGINLLWELYNSSYCGVFGNESQFDKNGNMNHGYDITYYGDNSKPITGTWVDNKLNLSVVHPVRGIESFCSKPCAGGSIRMQRINQPKCCYDCVRCGNNQISNAKKTGCITCDNRTRPDKSRTHCIKLPLLHLDRHWVIAVYTLAGVGSMLSIFCILLFCYYKDNDIIIASAPELSYPLLIGTFLSYALTFVIIADQTAYYCGIRRFGLGFCFSLSYSALLTKTIRLARVFNINRPMGTAPPKFIDTPSQLFILFALVFIQCSLALIGLFLEPPQLEWVEEDFHIMQVCKMPLYDILTSYAYNFILLCVCTVYTFQTRKVPACFNEARNIGFAMYTTLVIWISFLPAYIVDINKSSEIIALCMNIVLHATSVLCCVFGRKVYMIVFHWERTKRTSSLHSLTQIYCLDNDLAIPRKMTSQSLYSEITKLRSMSHVSLAK